MNPSPYPQNQNQMGFQGYSPVPQYPPNPPNYGQIPPSNQGYNYSSNQVFPMNLNVKPDLSNPQNNVNSIPQYTFPQNPPYSNPSYSTPPMQNPVVVPNQYPQYPQPTNSTQPQSIPMLQGGQMPNQNQNPTNQNVQITIPAQNNYPEVTITIKNVNYSSSNQQTNSVDPSDQEHVGAYVEPQSGALPAAPVEIQKPNH